uniref:Agrin n=1 Tax=Wuchereria bancrofti TaxID=6293 RepID=A0A1I8EK75_WUCBA
MNNDHHVTQNRTHLITKCEEVRCPYGAKCRPNSGECECRSFCNTAGPTVCGTDSVSYLSECHLAVRSCLARSELKSEIRVKQIGACGESFIYRMIYCIFGTLFIILNLKLVLTCYKWTNEKRNPCEDLRCGPGEQCVISENGKGYISAHCVCPEQCDNFGDSVESSPVCSNDGTDYPSLCHLRAHACKTKRNESVKYYGKCGECIFINFSKTRFSCIQIAKNWIKNPCKDFICSVGTVCKVTADRRAECRCSQQCAMHSDPVCATDGNTYENECLMSVSACRHDNEVLTYHKGRCRDDNPCKLIHCSELETCHIQENGKAVCRCTEYCPPVTKPICSINGKTYDNECVMRRSACMSKIQNAVRHAGPCGFGVCAGYDGCRPFEVCIDRDGHPVCECEACDSQLNEVCASDGITYANECKMRLESCLTNKFIYQKYSGVCDGCVNVHCEFYAICVSDEAGGGSCRCPNQCAYDDSGIVCATDGVTYLSECHMRQAACQQQKFIVIAFRGPCDSCSNIACLDEQQCEESICSCPSSCPNTTENSTVCGTDGILYPSKCHLKMAICHSGSEISVQNLNNCKQTLPKIDECSCNRVGSYSNMCDQHGQCRCLPGVSGRKCDHCASGFWGLHLIAKGALGCQPCGCSVFGSSRFDCEQSSGRCQCKSDSYGIKCDACDPDSVLTSSGCLKRAEFHAPKDCNELRCHHGAVCLIASSGMPICKCSKQCSLDHLGIVAEMTICGSDGNTYDNICELQQFACLHQLDLVPSTLGICSQDGSDGNSEMQRRRERKLDTMPILGNLCVDDTDCHVFNTYCGQVNFLGLKNCKCREGFLPSKDMTQCIQEKNNSNGNSWSLDGSSGMQIIIRKSLNRLLSVQMQVQTYNTSGVLLYNGLNKMNDFILLLLSDLKLIFSFSLRGEIFIMEWKSLLDINRSYRVTITFSYNQISLAVDDFVPVVFKLPPAVISYPLKLDTPIYLGHTPVELLRSYSMQTALNNFTGCLSNIFINGHEISTTDMRFLGDIAHCSQNICVKSCLNGNSCLLDATIDAKPLCQCIQHFNGQLCEQQICRSSEICGDSSSNIKMMSEKRLNMKLNHTVPLFVGDGFLMSEKLVMDVKEKLEIEIWLKAINPDGLVFYWTNFHATTEQYTGGYFIALVLIFSQPHFFWNFGSGVVYSRSTASVLNDQFHSIHFGKYFRSGSLQVNDEQDEIPISQIGYSPNSTVIFIGGVPNKTILPSAVPELGIPFRGAIQRLTINGHRFSELFKEFQRVGRVMQYDDVPCSNVKSGNRNCLRNLNKYGCQCLNEYQPPKYIQQDEEAGAVPNDSLLFDGRNEYALVKKMVSKRRSKILTDYQFMVKTNKSEGLIWWESKRHMIRSDYIAIFLLAGRLGFAINLGSSPEVKVIGSNTIVNDNQWHSVALLREKRKSLLIVDNEKVTYISPSRGKKKIPRGFPVKIPYKGCLRNLRISSQVINIRREFSLNKTYRRCEN